MAYIILAAFLWSLDGIIRRGLFDINPPIVVFWEHVIGTIILFPFVYKNLKELKKT